MKANLYESRKENKIQKEAGKGPNKKAIKLKGGQTTWPGCIFLRRRRRSCPWCSSAWSRWSGRAGPSTGTRFPPIRTETGNLEQKWWSSTAWLLTARPSTARPHPAWPRNHEAWQWGIESNDWPRYCLLHRYLICIPCQWHATYNQLFELNFVAIKILFFHHQRCCIDKACNL